APCDRDGLTKRYTERAVEWIGQHRDRPFFLYMPQAMPGSTRTPFASPAFRGKSNNGPWGDSIEELDWSLGVILDKLVEFKIAEDTLVVWTSDNGAPLNSDTTDLSRGSNLPLHGRGYTTSEGAFRVPTIVWQPGSVPANTTCDELASTMDLLPTFAKLAGGGAARERRIDGRDIRPLLFGEPNAKSPHEAYYYYYQDQLHAVRSGPWKLFLPVASTRHPHYPPKGKREPLLFHLFDDVGCRKNVASEHADVVAKLMRLAETAREDLGDKGRAGRGQRQPGKATAKPTPRLLPAKPKSTSKHTNILLITADNLGYGDLACYNSKSNIKTPHIDVLATQGARLTNFYTASPTCTVSRACLLTGRIPQRHGLLNQLSGVKGNYGVGLNHAEVLLPEILQQGAAPYATGCFGKWNIGFAKGSRPTERGFDEFIGNASGNLDYYRHNYREMHDLYRGVEPLRREGEYVTDIIADGAIEFMRRHSRADRPWFCYLPFNAPHFPVAGNKRPGEPNVWQAPRRALAAYGFAHDEADPRKRYAAVVTALDEALGRVLGSLDELGVAENTFVFFYSDNGAFRLGRAGIDVGLNTPLRHGGVTCWEGGLRVAAIARWPGEIQPGSRVDQVCWSPDLLVTCAAIAGAKPPADRPLDGENILPLLKNKQARSPHRSLYFSFRNHAALRKGVWKIVRERPNNPWQLYDLSTDIGESRDLAKQFPDRVAELAKEWAEWE
ncbi:MAG: sulfatase-like hydrolase/transferase, partial [Pirellulaceae bacterium]|nr:sulfatase-like hydrolase/transferase [Pirellulaceae bacterium]